MATTSSTPPCYQSLPVRAEPLEPTLCSECCNSPGCMTAKKTSVAFITACAIFAILYFSLVIAAQQHGGPDFVARLLLPQTAYIGLAFTVGVLLIDIYLIISLVKNYLETSKKKEYTLEEIKELFGKQFDTEIQPSKDENPDRKGYYNLTVKTIPSPNQVAIVKIKLNNDDVQTRYFIPTHFQDSFGIGGEFGDFIDHKEAHAAIEEGKKLFIKAELKRNEYWFFDVYVKQKVVTLHVVIFKEVHMAFEQQYHEKADKTDFKQKFLKAKANTNMVDAEEKFNSSYDAQYSVRFVEHNAVPEKLKKFKNHALTDNKPYIKNIKLKNQEGDVYAVKFMKADTEKKVVYYKTQKGREEKFPPPKPPPKIT